MRGCFITGTDTGVGKTLISIALLRGFQARGFRAVGMKPVASGAVVCDDGLRNEDAVALHAASNVAVPLSDVNPYCFEEPVCPHIAAAAAATSISTQTITAVAGRLRAGADLLVVEGIGGWRVPLSAEATVADLALALGLPVILVVGLRLGCINHALLSAEAIHGDGVRFAGWVSNQIEPRYRRRNDTLSTLAERLPGPLLADVGFHEPPCIEAIQAQISPAVDLLLKTEGS
jgi:dethiobiotin synthetase